MKNLFGLIKKILGAKENILLGLIILISVILIISLFISDFNFLKVVIFTVFVLVVVSLFLFLKIKRKPEEEKASFFFTFIQDLLDNLQEGIVLYDEEFRIIFVNQSFANLVNLRKEDLINLVVKSEMVKNEIYQTLTNIFFPFLQGENLKIIKQVPETIEVSFSSPEEKFFVISYVDIYLGKKYKLRVVLDKTQDIVESQKKLEFIQMVSHNLLTPLSEIRWNLEALNLEGISKENKDFIDIALKIIKSTIVLAESTLNLVRVELGNLELKIEEIDLEQIIVSSLDILREKIEDKKLKINIELEQGLTKISADRSILSLSLFALIENAVLYNRPGGQIDIKIQKLPQRPYLEIIIEDTGIGMTKKDLANLFKKYYRGEKSKNLDVKGFGIGLYNAKNLINFHGGEIKIESQEDKGTKVQVILPYDPKLIPSYKLS